ncbi:MAG: hypothetical protein KAX18_00315 [Candidatus Lokiarchaeota archaeon]|nr:hypothetical protein [Candidatus Lokiarchaeota archaeon]
MVLNDPNKEEELQSWEREFLAGHRWGRLKMWFPNDHLSLDSEMVSSELSNLKRLWDKIQPLNNTSNDILKSILALEICNWNLEASVLNICEAIGKEKSPTIPIGHSKSITNERWRNIWAYYLALRNWLPFEGKNGYEVLQNYCDTDGSVKKKIFALLGERNRLKELYVERLCLLFEYWLGGYNSLRKSPQIITHQAAVKSIEKEISKEDSDEKILRAMKFEGDGRLIPCNHKAFRRYEIIISSIGAGNWRTTMPRRGTDGLERAALLDAYLLAIESWIKDNKKGNDPSKNKLSQKIYNFLGEPDNVKIFLASLLISLLRPQQIAAKQLAENRIKK